VYRPLFEQVWGAGSLAINFPFNSEAICATPGGAAVFGGNNTPIPLSPADRTKANRVYDNWGQSISAYEASPRISAFSSKFDAYLAGNYTLTAEEQAGYDLFRGKAGCNTCHLDGRGSTQTPGTGSGSIPSTTTGTDTSAPANVEPLFTCFDYANLGVAYLGLADNSRGPLLSRLRGLSPPVVRSRNRLPAPYAALLSCFRPTDPAC
jgi:hypothetical protein